VKNSDIRRSEERGGVRPGWRRRFTEHGSIILFVCQ